MIFILVEGLLIYSMIKYRARKGAVAAQIHGNTQLEIGWTVGAAAILIFLTVFTFVLLDDIKNPAASDIDADGNPVSASNVLYASTDQPAPPEGSASMKIEVVGQQYAWTYNYPSLEEEARLRLQRHVRAGRHDRAARHQVDRRRALVVDPGARRQDGRGPGPHQQDLVQDPARHARRGRDQVVYKGQCAELCGRNHADMVARVIGLPYDEWKAWYDRKAADLKESRGGRR